MESFPRQARLSIGPKHNLINLVQASVTTSCVTVQTPGNTTLTSFCSGRSCSRWWHFSSRQYWRITHYLLWYGVPEIQIQILTMSTDATRDHFAAGVLGDTAGVHESLSSVCPDVKGEGSVASARYCISPFGERTQADAKQNKGEFTFRMRRWNMNAMSFLSRYAEIYNYTCTVTDTRQSQPVPFSVIFFQYSMCLRQCIQRRADPSCTQSVFCPDWRRTTTRCAWCGSSSQGDWCGPSRDIRFDTASLHIHNHEPLDVNVMLESRPDLD